MEFDKNKDEAKNIQILKAEIKSLRSPYAKILLEVLNEVSNPDEFRISIREKVNAHIENKIRK